MKQLLSLLVLFFLTGISGNTFAQEVKVNSDLIIETDGTVRMDNDATVWNDLMVFPDATGRGTTNAPAWAEFKNDGGSSQGVWLQWFNSSAEKELYFTVQIPHSYKVGTDLYPHVHWTTKAGTPNDDVTWGLEYTVVSIGGTFGNTTIIIGNAIVPAITPTGIEQHLITALPVISGSGLGISTIISCRLFRDVADANDTFGDLAGLLGFDLHYEEDTQGSRQEFIK